VKLYNKQIIDSSLRIVVKLKYYVKSDLPSTCETDPVCVYTMKRF